MRIGGFRYRIGHRVAGVRLCRFSCRIGHRVAGMRVGGFSCRIGHRVTSVRVGGFFHRMPRVWICRLIHLMAGVGIGGLFVALVLGLQWCRPGYQRHSRESENRVLLQPLQQAGSLFAVSRPLLSGD
ncbi:hypothetical protein [Parasphingopyxis sp.]|uniref:hypothetical protein n=1 Tax=Parasphingopyxis sp. TaxID=1920299 RepID=UPI0032EAB349